MSASLYVRPVFSSGPTFKFLPCIASMIKKKKRKENCRISSKSRVPTVKFARWKTGSKATILKQVTQKCRVSDACIILAWWPEKIVLDRVGDCWSYFIPFEFYTYWETDLKGNYYHCIAIITYLFFFPETVWSSLCRSFRFAATFGRGFETEFSWSIIVASVFYISLVWCLDTE